MNKANLISEETGRRLMALLGARNLAPQPQRPRGQSSRLVMVQCDSATAVGGDPVLAQCYPATILDPAADYAAPPEELYGCLLTVLGASGNSETPTAGAVYLCVLTGEVEGDRSGSVAGRPRAFGVPVPGAAATVSAWKEPVRVATTAAGTLASSFENGDTVDGVVLATGDRILIKNQSTASENGIYTVNASGAPTRATDADSGAELLGATVAVTNGTANADSVWLCTANATISVGVTSLPWVRVGPTNSGQQTYTSSVSITADDTWTDTGHDITLPSAGTYLVIARVNGNVGATSITATTPPRIIARLYDETAAAVVAGTGSVVVQADVTNTFTAGSTTIQTVITVTQATTIRVEALRQSGSTYDHASVGGTANSEALTGLSYVRVG